MIFKGSRCFQFSEAAVVTSTAKESPHYQMQFTASSHCFIGVETACTTVTNFGSDGKPMLSLSVVVHYQVLLGLDTYNMDTIAITGYVG